MIEINNLTKEDVQSSFLKEVARFVFKKEKTKDPRLSVVLVDPKKAKDLNKTYRRKSYVPNVLSFAEPELGLGEIVLCPQAISQDAVKYGIIFKQELCRVFIHGILHLLGYSHKEMKKKEELYFSEFSHES